MQCTYASNLSLLFKCNVHNCIGHDGMYGMNINVVDLRSYRIRQLD